jgi:Uma2 family endonuclease
MQPVRHMTEEEYLAFDDATEGKHWYANGQIYAMAGGTPRHSAICNNVGAALKSLVAKRRCLVFQSDLRVHVPETGLYNYPDVTVVCGNAERHPKSRNTVVNPTVIVEVLSKSTQGDDRGAKSTHYRSLPSLKEYLLVSTRSEHV